MQYSYVDVDKMKSLEEYAVSVVMGLMSLKTIMSYHAKAQSLGILTEDQTILANTILWDISRLLKACIEQADSVLELVAGDITIESILEDLKKHEKTRARGLLRQKNEA